MTHPVSPEYREGVLYGVRIPETETDKVYCIDVVLPCTEPWEDCACHNYKKRCDAALAQARKDALPFEDQDAARILLRVEVNLWENDPKEQPYSSISWEVNEVEQYRYKDGPVWSDWLDMRFNSMPNNPAHEHRTVLHYIGTIPTNG